ncbi:MAG: DUF1028 domain-containing protein [Chitinophagaceae bacterium]|nr:DUF1028 domain-containing protein [Chitinophagaceae bacterium]
MSDYFIFLKEDTRQHVKRALFPALITLCFLTGSAQNLPSLLLEKDINATFSIIAYDKQKREWGIAVATNNIYVGNSTIYIEPGIGAFSIIAETDPSYAIAGFRHLKAGKSIQESIECSKKDDKEWFNRQVAGIDSAGNVYAFTGSSLKYWQGMSDHIIGDGFVVMGNQLAKDVLQTMYNVYEGSRGTLAERLIKSLIAGQQAGGQIQGKQSAALVVKGAGNEWFNQIDLRVDNSKTPFKDLQKLLDHHYGRIRLNQAIRAIRNNDTQKGSRLLSEATVMLEGWNGIYPKIALAYLLLKEDKKAIGYIKKGLAETDAWKEFLPSFYLIRNDPSADGLISEDSFDEKDWSSAIYMLVNTNRLKEAAELSEDLLTRYPTTLIYYLSGKVNLQLGNRQKAKEHLSKSLQLDANNEESKILLAQLK